MKRLYQVQIAGQQLSIRSEEGELYVNELAQFVEGHVDRLVDGRRSASPQRVALLVAMQIADELFRAKDLHRRFRAQVQRRLQELDIALVEHEKMLAPQTPPSARTIKHGEAKSRHAAIPDTDDDAPPGRSRV